MLSSVMVTAKTRRRRTDPSAILPRRFPPALPARAPTRGALWFGSAAARVPRSTRRSPRAHEIRLPRDDPRARAVRRRPRDDVPVRELPGGPARRRRRGRGGGRGVPVGRRVVRLRGTRARRPRVRVRRRRFRGREREWNAHGRERRARGSGRGGRARGGLGGDARAALRPAPVAPAPSRIPRLRGPQSAKLRTAPRPPTCGKCARWSPPPPAGTSPSARTAPPPPPRRCPCCASSQAPARRAPSACPYLPTRWVRAGEDPAAAGGVGGLPRGRGARRGPGAGRGRRGPGLGAGPRARGDEDEEEQEDIEDADDF